MADVAGPTPAVHTEEWPRSDPDYHFIHQNALTLTQTLLSERRHSLHHFRLTLTSK